ncbi:hypothetical protein V6N11_050626 [Hibiscus sabdariffa]|uniref:Uncharacterized protein n=1 Tax=Hibiscus sabdariffa TaxID=183260 RepID=A0ABR2TB60_9ROSI
MLIIFKREGRHWEILHVYDSPCSATQISSLPTLIHSLPNIPNQTRIVPLSFSRSKFDFGSTDLGENEVTEVLLLAGMDLDRFIFQDDEVERWNLHRNEPWCGDFPELQEIRAIFVSRYSKEFDARAIELRNNCEVNTMISLYLDMSGIEIGT